MIWPDDNLANPTSVHCQKEETHSEKEVKAKLNGCTYAKLDVRKYGFGPCQKTPLINIDLQNVEVKFKSRISAYKVCIFLESHKVW